MRFVLVVTLLSVLVTRQSLAQGTEHDPPVHPPAVPVEVVPSPLSQLFQVALQVPLGNAAVSQVALNFPRPAIIEQISAQCAANGSSSSVLKLTADVPLAKEFESEEAEPNTVRGGFVNAVLPSVPFFPDDSSSSFVPPTLVRILALGRVGIEIFRGSSGTGSGFCFVSLVGRWTH